MTQTPAKKTSGASGCLGLIVILVVVGFIFGKNDKTATSPGAAAPAASNLKGAFIDWVPVDEGHGYAYFSITNNGSATATAKCTVSVTDDFGDFGFDMLVGETVGPGQTIKGRVPLSVGKGSFLINAGEVKDC